MIIRIEQSETLEMNCICREKFFQSIDDRFHTACKKTISVEEMSQNRSLLSIVSQLVLERMSILL